jgi:hypothetical protein
MDRTICHSVFIFLTGILSVTFQEDIQDWNSSLKYFMQQHQRQLRKHFPYRSNGFFFYNTCNYRLVVHLLTHVHLGYCKSILTLSHNLYTFWTVIGDCSTVLSGGHHGRDHMVVGFITTYAISVYHH